MTADYPVGKVPATPEYVFELFRDYVRTWTWLAAPAPYEAVADDPADRHFGRYLTNLEIALEDAYGIELPESLAVELGALDRMSVREVCGAIAAALGTRPVIRPWRHVGGECLPAGAFLTVQSMLAASGAKPEKITPRTLLSRYLFWYGQTLVGGLARLAPGRVPAVRERFPLWGFLCVIFAAVPIGVVLLLSECGIRMPVWAFLAAAYGGFPFTVTGLALMVRSLMRPRMGELVTFRDLAYCLAGQQPRRAIQPTS
jgi:hypothetical protein